MSGKEPNSTEVISQSLTYSGPLPTSNEFEGYERALPGAADRILIICEKEVEHRHKNEDKIVTQSLRLEGRGQIFAFILSFLSIGAIVASIFFSRPVMSIAPTLIAITSIASIFSSNNKKK